MNRHWIIATSAFFLTTSALSSDLYKNKDVYNDLSGTQVIQALQQQDGDSKGKVSAVFRAAQKEEYSLNFNLNNFEFNQVSLFI